MPALIKRFNAELKKEQGFTLAEVIIAFFIITLLTGVVIHSSMLAINTSQINKTKTIALALINEEIEEMRAMKYEDLGLVGGNPEGVFEDELVTEDGFLINYNISWADGEQSYKQVSVSAYKEPMVTNLEAITRIYPRVAVAPNEGETAQYPPPKNLTLDSDNGSMLLNWESPDTDLDINNYNVYRDNSYLSNSAETNYTDSDIQDNQSYTYHVTAVYKDTTESEPSNEVSN